MAFSVSVVWYAKRGCEADVELLLRTLQQLTLEEPGCIHYYVHRSEERGKFFLYEQYVDRDAFDAHHETHHYRMLVQGEAPDLVERRDILRGETL